MQTSRSLLAYWLQDVLVDLALHDIINRISIKSLKSISLFFELYHLKTSVMQINTILP